MRIAQSILWIAVAFCLSRFAFCAEGPTDLRLVLLIGLIPCAFGGTSLDQWKPGSALYTNAVARARDALIELGKRDYAAYEKVEKENAPL